MSGLLTRRRFLAAGAATLCLPGCDFLSTSPTYRDMVLAQGERLSYAASRIFGRGALAREYAPADMSPHFRTNGSTNPQDQDYQLHAAQGFNRWALKVDGLVERPSHFTLPELMAMPSRSQITRHDCVEGWSAIGKWTGVPLAQILDAVQLKPDARFILFHCADRLLGFPYYESIDLIDAYHPQTILAYRMNDAVLPVGHGAPLRLRVERQLGYKHAKFVMRVEAIADRTEVGFGGGGFWEDFGNYEWYAGI